jgi:hypothetical protein
LGNQWITQGRPRGPRPGLRIIAFAAFALALLLPSSATAKVHQPDFSADFSLPEANGYSISVSGSHTSTQIEVTEGRSGPKHLVFSNYTFRGSASKRGIHANLGRFGTVAMRFKPSGEVRTAKPPKASKGCRGPRKIVRHLGTFIGVFRFQGGDGYTTAEATEVSGSVGDPEAFICALVVGGSGRGHHHRHGRFRPPSPYLGATTTHNGIGFAAAVLGRHGKRVSFVASSTEKEGRASISRWASVAGSRPEFQFDHGLSTATVTPPLPFAGTATFERGPKGSQPSWSGSLSVSFPGRPEVPLTGANFTSLLFARF